MRRMIHFVTGLLLVPGFAAAQTEQQPRWDANVSAGLFQARPSDNTRGWDDWYHEGRYAAAIGYYWSTHFKTEIEFAVTGEGRQFTQQLVHVPGTNINQPISVEQFHRVKQASARAVWQFNDNAWVHPYLNAGFVHEIDRLRQWSPDRFYYGPGDARGAPRIPLPHIDSNEHTDHRAGFTIGGGSKFFVSPSAYINTAVQITRAKPNTTVTLLAGIGVEF